MKIRKINRIEKVSSRKSFEDARKKKRKQFVTLNKTFIQYLNEAMGESV